MRLLDLPQAKHFCTPTPTVLASVGRQSLRDYHFGLSPGSPLLVEGTTRFEIHQVNLLESVQRWLVYALGNYRRAVEMLVPVSAPWSQVTLYYSSFYSANAILGMFGGWIGHTKSGNRVVDVERGAAGNQELRVHRRLRSPAGAVGSHKTFWDFFYDSAASISSWAPVALQTALTPVNGDFAWQIGERNNVNYDMFHAWDASRQMSTTFQPAKLKSLTGPLQLQREATERLVMLALWFANQCDIPGDALAGCGATGKRQQMQRRLLTQRTPTLVTQSALADLLDT